MLEAGNAAEGRFEITLSRQDIVATCNFYPAEDHRNTIRSDAFTLYLDHLNIRYGVKWDNIDTAIETCNLKKEPVFNVLIAEGDYPKNDVAEYYELNPALNSARPSQDGGGQVDYKAYTPFIIVKKDQRLAVLRRRVAGIDGHDVHDSIVPYEVIAPQGYSPGENTRLEEDGRYIVSNIHGQLIENKKVLAVRETLVVNGPVGYQTGHISFPGDIVIAGPVSDGFRIYAGKSLTIKNTFDVTEAITKDDLSVSGGIIGRGQAVVKSGGVIKTRFIDNCRVACRRNIVVLKEIVNCQIYSLGAVDLGDKGIILSSKIYALNGVRAKTVGKKSSRITGLYCGVDFTVLQDKAKTTALLRENALRLDRYGNLLGALGGGREDAEKRKRLEEIIGHLQREQKKNSAHISDLMTKVNSNEKAVVEISGDVAAGTCIEICQVSLVVEEPLRKVRFRLDKDSMSLVTEKM
jgi:uncharacterized protein (DUF342 family)